MRFRSTLPLFGLVALGLSSCAPEAPFSIDYEAYTLDNGLQVILHEDRSDPITAVAVLYHVGSGREDDLKAVVQGIGLIVDGERRRRGARRESQGHQSKQRQSGAETHDASFTDMSCGKDGRREEYRHGTGLGKGGGR